MIFIRIILPIYTGLTDFRNINRQIVYFDNNIILYIQYCTCVHNIAPGPVKNYSSIYSGTTITYSLRNNYFQKS